MSLAAPAMHRQPEKGPMFKSRISRKAGLPPGSVVYVGDRKAGPIRITVLEYGEEGFEEREVKTLEECLPRPGKHSVTWIDITGVHDTELIAKLGSLFSLHPLLLEDIAHTNQRPKVEDYGSQLYVVLRILTAHGREEEIENEQVSLILTPGVVISLQEQEGDDFLPLRERIRNSKGRMRKRGADFLLYAMMDLVVDNYFKVLEQIGDHIEDLQEQVIAGSGQEDLHHIQRLKREVIFFRKSVWPLRDVVSALQRNDTGIMENEMRPYLRDLHDHVIQVMDAVETFRDMLSAILDIHLSAMSNKMNQVMKILTIIATIFIPITFLAGVYGMNFHYMPELQWRWGYLSFWLLVVASGVFMVIWFKKKNWL